jgi:2-polyprenyl-3-methyl-5-hydroxy-6-metoxy-1,4-benzoquinol methylase
MDQYYNTRYTFDKGRKRIWMVICHYLQKYIPTDAAVMDIGAGYCNFINNIKGGTKYTVDCNTNSKSFYNADIHFMNTGINDIDTKNKVDVIFISNLLEHLNDVQLDNLFSKLSVLLNPNGKTILIQPNYYYASRSKKRKPL